MPQSYGSDSRHSSAPTKLRTMGYRSTLNHNGLEFFNHLSMVRSKFFSDLNQEAWAPLLATQKGLKLSTHYTAAFVDYFDVEFDEHGFRDDDLILRAQRLIKQMTTMSTERENGGWKRFLEYELFTHFEFFERFSSSQDLSWKYDYYPRAIARQSLVNPKPDFAFGLKVIDESAEDLLAQRLAELSDPSVSASCIPSDRLRIMFPFLILESKSLQGDPLSAMHQMAHSFIKALDIIAASGQEDNLFVLGICQVGFLFEIHIGHCTSISTQATKPLKYEIERLSSGDLRSPIGMICLLRFLDAARHYGEHYFSQNIIQSLRKLGESIPEAPDIAPDIADLRNIMIERP